MNTREIFETMQYGPAPESDEEARAWLAQHSARFGHFIGGTFTEPGATFASKNPANGETLAEITQGTHDDVAEAVASAKAAFTSWSERSCTERARYLYALARLLQKHARLFAVLETMDNGKPIRESRDIDIPLAQRHFYYHAGLAQLRDQTHREMEPIGVCGQVIPWNFPLLMLAWKVAPALAAGNTLVLKPAEYTSLTALLFADICREAGLPAGVVNIVTGDGQTGEALVTHPDTKKIAFTGSTSVGRRIREQCAGMGKSLTLELGGKSPYIVFEDADIDSAIEGLVDAIWFNQGQVCCAGSRLLIHESIATDFEDRLRERMQSLRMGDPLDKCIDIGAMVDPVQLERVSSLVEAENEGEVFQPIMEQPERGCFYPPTLISGLSPASHLMQEEIFGPVLVSTTFRTPAEAVEIANNTRFGLAASLWTENINLALDIAPKLTGGVVWVNSTNLLDAAAPFGGVRESGFGREGGKDGLRAYLKPNVPALPNEVLNEPSPPDQPDAPAIDRTAKLYIGGKQARPDSGYSRTHYARSGQLIGHTGLGNRKDIRNAVEAARGAESWGRTSGHLRAQILYYLAENLSARAGEMSSRLQECLDLTQADAEAEVAASLEQLFTFAAWADKRAGQIEGVPIRGAVLAMNEPVGIVGALAPDQAPLLSTISLIGAALSMGNRIVIAASQAAPLVACDLYQILDTSDIPAGVVNIVTGHHRDLGETLASHAEIDALWSFSPHLEEAKLELAAAGNLKRVWLSQSHVPDWSKAHEELLNAATETKAIWIPYGI